MRLDGTLASNNRLVCKEDDPKSHRVGPFHHAREFASNSLKIRGLSCLGRQLLETVQQDCTIDLQSSTQLIWCQISYNCFENSLYPMPEVSEVV